MPLGPAEVPMSHRAALSYIADIAGLFATALLRGKYVPNGVPSNVRDVFRDSGVDAIRANVVDTQDVTSPYLLFHFVWDKGAKRTIEASSLMDLFVEALGLYLANMGDAEIAEATDLIRKQLTLVKPMASPTVDGTVSSFYVLQVTLKSYDFKAIDTFFTAFEKLRHRDVLDVWAQYLDPASPNRRRAIMGVKPPTDELSTPDLAVAPTETTTVCKDMTCAEQYIARRNLLPFGAIHSLIRLETHPAPFFEGFNPIYIEPPSPAERKPAVAAAVRSAHIGLSIMVFTIVMLGFFY